MTIVLILGIVAALGAIVFLSVDGKPGELARLAYGAAALVLLWLIASGGA